MDPPEQRHYRQALNPYLSPAAVTRWTPVVDELVRASLDEKIETGRIDFVDDLANIVPGGAHPGHDGHPAEELDDLLEPVHAAVYTPPDSPDMARVTGRARSRCATDLLGQLAADQGEPQARA